MPEAVEWLADGTPRSPRFQDIYRSASGGLAQARHVFLRGCGLPAAWAGQRQWRILETGFGLGLNFLATWRAWKDDPQRPRLLHFSSLEGWPVAAADLLRSAAGEPELLPLAQQLAGQWIGLVPGVHRLSFEDGHVLLTLAVVDAREALREPAGVADSVFLDGFDPERNPRMWDHDTIKAVARHCHRGTRLATWTVAGEVRRELAQCGFVVEKGEGLPPKRHCLRAVFEPNWQPRGSTPAADTTPERCIVVGGGLAGAAVAASLARRGWRVTVVDSADAPAAGASALPAGLLAPHASADDGLLSRLTRCGVRMTLHYARTYLPEGDDWRFTGVLEHRPGPSERRTADMADAGSAWTRPATASQLEAADLTEHQPASWHELGAWIRPRALVRAWLSEPGVTWRGGTTVASVAASDGAWQLAGRSGERLGEAELVVLAAAHGNASLQHQLSLHPVRGQVSWAFQPAGLRLPPFPVNGHGHFIPGAMVEGARAWLCGSTYERGVTDRSPRDADHQFNLDRLRVLLPFVAQQLAPAFADGSVQAWTGVRCVSADRRPYVGELQPGLWVSTAMGSRGLTFAALCAELLAARLHGEPLPLEQRLADALDTARGLR